MEHKDFPISKGNEQIKLSDFGKNMLSNGIVFALSAVMAHVSTLEFFSPLGIAFCAGISKEYTLFSCLGGMLGYIISSDSVTSFRYIMTILLVYILKIYVNSFPKLRDKLLPYSVVSLFATASTGIIVSFATEFNMNVLFLRLAEFLTSFGGAYFFNVGFRSLKKIRKDEQLTNRELIFSAVSFLIVVMSFGSISLFGVTLSGIICSYSIMCVSYAFREKGGALIGTGASLGFVMTGNATPYVFCYSVAGMFSGLFAYSGRILCAMAYIFSYGSIYLFFGGNKDNILAPLIESALASVLFVLTPQSFFYKTKFRLYIRESNENVTMNMVKKKLDMIKDGMVSLNSTIDFLSEKLKDSTPPKTAGIYLKVRDRVCSDCASYQKCWKSELFKTIGEFDDIVDTMRKEEKITPTMTPMSLQGRCIRIMSLCDSFNKNYSSYCTALGTEGKIHMMREITKDQFVTITNMLDDLTEDFENGIRPLSEKSDLYKKCLESSGISADVICYEDENLNEFLNITLDKDCEIEIDEMKNILFCADEKVFETPTIIEGENSKIFLFWEKPYFKVECDYFQIPRKEGDVCGDCFDSFYDGRGNFVAVLSDGMGTGMNAAIDGNVTAGLFSKLIVWGFSFPCALRLVNSAMMLKSSNESMATLDILKVNLYTGKATVYKAGATISLMKRDNKVNIIKKAAMPVGILRETEFAKVRGTLKNNDEIILMSDGATDNGVRELKQFINSAEYKEKCAEDMCKFVKNNCKDKCDDITVGVIKIEKNKEN